MGISVENIVPVFYRDLKQLQEKYYFIRNLYKRNNRLLNLEKKLEEIVQELKSEINHYKNFYEFLTD